MIGPADVVARSQAGSALGRLGDLRFRADRFWLPDEELLGFIRVDAGAFMMGSDPQTDPAAQDDEQPQHLVELPEYYIARYPATVAQFCAFVMDSGFKVEHPDSLRGIPNHPVVLVSFYEALAYCAWLTEQLKRADWTPPLLREQLAAGWAITLPSEAEWEKAARGTDGRIYPWGNEFDAAKANSTDAGLGATRSVGLFPDGRSPYDALDMSGNVWELTCSIFPAEKRRQYAYPYSLKNAESEHVPDSGRVRVVRGAGFLASARLARAAFAYPVMIDGSGDAIGFRLVSSRLRP
jgi:formylglycine-generating enzyme required for sulfatase activity